MNDIKSDSNGNKVLQLNTKTTEPAKSFPMLPPPKPASATKQDQEEGEEERQILKDLGEAIESDDSREESSGEEACQKEIPPTKDLTLSYTQCSKDEGYIMDQVNHEDKQEQNTDCSTETKRAFVEEVESLDQERPAKRRKKEEPNSLVILSREFHY